MRVTVASPGATAAVHRPSPSQGLSLLAFSVGAAIVLLSVLGLSWYTAWVMGQAISAGKPVITFATADVGVYGAVVSVTSASTAYAPTNFQLNLAVNGVLGSAVPMQQYGPTGIDVSGTYYQITWADIGYDGLLNGGDYFRISDAYGTLPGSSAFTFYLLWRDGTTIASASFYTP